MEGCTNVAQSPSRYSGQILKTGNHISWNHRESRRFNCARARNHQPGRADDLDTTGVNEYRAQVPGVPPVCTVPVTMLSPTITEAADYYAAVAGHGEIGNVTLRVVPRQEPSLSRVSASLSDFSRAHDSQANQRKVKVTSTVNNARYTTVYARWKKASDTPWNATTPVKTRGILFAPDTRERSRQAASPLEASPQTCGGGAAHLHDAGPEISPNGHLQPPERPGN